MNANPSTAAIGRPASPVASPRARIIAALMSALFAASCGGGGSPETGSVVSAQGNAAAPDRGGGAAPVTDAPVDGSGATPGGAAGGAAGGIPRAVFEKALATPHEDWFGGSDPADPYVTHLWIAPTAQAFIVGARPRHHTRQVYLNVGAGPDYALQRVGAGDTLAIGERVVLRSPTLHGPPMFRSMLGPLLRVPVIVPLEGFDNEWRVEGTEGDPGLNLKMAVEAVPAHADRFAICFTEQGVKPSGPMAPFRWCSEHRRDSGAVIAAHADYGKGALQPFAIERDTHHATGYEQTPPERVLECRRSTTGADGGRLNLEYPAVQWNEGARQLTLRHPDRVEQVPADASVSTPAPGRRSLNWNDAGGSGTLVLDGAMVSSFVRTRRVPAQEELRCGKE